MWYEQKHLKHSAQFPTFLFLPHFDITDLLLNRHMTTRSLFVNLKMSRCSWELPVHKHCGFQEPLCRVFLRPGIKMTIYLIKAIPVFLCLVLSDWPRFSCFQKKALKNAMTTKFQIQTLFYAGRSVCNFGGSSFSLFTFEFNLDIDLSFVAMLTL